MTDNGRFLFQLVVIILRGFKNLAGLYLNLKS
jgi:hypothetical protein